jgi:cell division protein FtsB
MDEQERRRNIRRTALIVAAVAFAFYFGFIAIGVLRS